MNTFIVNHQRERGRGASILVSIPCRFQTILILPFGLWRTFGINEIIYNNPHSRRLGLQCSSQPIIKDTVWYLVEHVLDQPTDAGPG